MGADMHTTTSPVLPTIGEISRRIDQPHHRIAYVIKTRRIAPCGRAGHARVFDEEAVREIADACRRIDLGERLDAVDGGAGR